MRSLVAVASKHGATEEIAPAIARSQATARIAGIDAEATKAPQRDPCERALAAHADDHGGDDERTGHVVGAPR